MYSLKHVDQKVLSKVAVPNQEEIVRLTREKLDPLKAYRIIKEDTKEFTRYNDKAGEADRLFAELLAQNGIELPPQEKGKDEKAFALEVELEQERARALALIELELELEMEGKL